IVSAIDLDHMSSSQLEGAARLFSDWSFGVTYPDGLQRIPDSLKDALWDHVKNSEYEEKRIRAQEAFQPK
ncbi:MAG TPA: hypothetical protein VLA12_07650, partial [Planctomycetaceae bacterium]|nr:hypothetical protein [Planctomycetaceae bacterium]